MLAEFEFAGQIGPSLLFAAGWIVADECAEIKFILESETERFDFSSDVFSYKRGDLDAVSLKGVESVTRRGFAVLVSSPFVISSASSVSVEAGDVRRQIQPLSSSTACVELPGFFSNCWQPVRHRLAKLVTTLSGDALFAPCQAALSQAIQKWVGEIDWFSGALTLGTAAGIDCAICTSSGKMFVEGWQIKRRGSEELIVDFFASDFTDCRYFSDFRAFRRPDLGRDPSHQDTSEFPGFILLTSGLRSVHGEPLLVVQVTCGEKITYTKIAIERRSHLVFSQLVWRRILDSSSINAGTADRAAEFMRLPYDRIPDDVAPTISTESGAAIQPLAVVVTGLSADCARSRIFRATAFVGHHYQGRVVAVTGRDDGESKDRQHWPIGGRLRQVEICQTVHDLSRGAESVVADYLIVSASTLCRSSLLTIVSESIARHGSVEHDEVRAFLPASFRAVPTEPEVEFDLLGVRKLRLKARGLLRQSDKLGSTDANLILNRGASLPPMLLKSRTFSRSVLSTWPNPCLNAFLWALLSACSRTGRLTCEFVDGIEVYHHIPTSAEIDETMVLNALRYL